MRTPTEYPTDRLTGLINAAVERGIIDAGQRASLEALAAELSPQGARREARRAFNAISIAYSLGGLLVLFALAWFLVERWRTLGRVGVLAVAAVYAGTFAGVGTLLRRRGFTVAGGLAIVLAVGMTPVWTWAVLRLTGEMPDPFAWDNALARYEPYIGSRVTILALATIGVALATLRRVQFFALGIPLAAGFVAFLMGTGQALGDPRLAWYVGPYYQCAVACATLAVAYAVDRRQPPDEDYAFWFYLAGVAMLFVAYAQVWPHIGRWRHALPLVAAAMVTGSLYLHRRTLLVGGSLMAFAYLGYLAFDVFRRVIALPIALATLGLLVIVATVWMQRRFPALVARVNREGETERKSLPAGPVAVLGPLLIAVVATAFAGAEARERTAERELQAVIWQKHLHNQTRAHPKAPNEIRRPGQTFPDTAGRPPRP